MILTKVCTCLSNQLQLLLQVDSLAGKPEPLLATVKRRKLSLFGRTTRHNTIAKAILQGILEGKRRWGCQRKNWLENIQQWTHRDLPTLLCTAEDRQCWRGLCVNGAPMTVPIKG